MAYCLNCNKEASGRSKYCGDACKVAWNRNRKRNTEALIKNVTSQSVTKYPRVSDPEFTKLMATAGLGHVRVSKPGDADYEPQCETTKAFVEDRPTTITKADRHVDASDIGITKAIHQYFETPTVTDFTKTKFKPKRGLDIKCFEDLPPDVQEAIKAESQSDEEFQRRTGIAIRYQHIFSGRY